MHIVGITVSNCRFEVEPPTGICLFGALLQIVLEFKVDGVGARLGGCTLYPAHRGVIRALGRAVERAIVKSGVWPSKPHPAIDPILLVLRP